MRTRRSFLLVAIFVLFAAFGGYWIWQSHRTQVVVENLSKDDFTDVVVAVAGTAIWSGDIKAGASIKKGFRPQSEAAFLIEGQWQGRKLTSSLGYTTFNDRMLHRITLTSEGELRYAVTR